MHGAMEQQVHKMDYITDGIRVEYFGTPHVYWKTKMATVWKLKGLI